MRWSWGALAALSLIVPLSLVAVPAHAQAGLALTTVPDGPFLCQVDAGQANNDFDDAYYLRFKQPGPESRVGLDAMRLRPPPGYEGLVVGAWMDDGQRDWDHALNCQNGGGVFVTICPGGTGAFCNQGDVFIMDMDGATGYGSRDCVYLNLDQNLETPNAKVLGPNDLRLTSCTIGSTTYPAATIVQPGDQDTNTFSDPGELSFSSGYRHADLNNNGVVDPEDKIIIALREDGNIAQVSTALDIVLPLPPPSQAQTGAPPVVDEQETTDDTTTDDATADDDASTEDQNDTAEPEDPEEVVDEQARDDAAEAKQLATEARDAADDAARSASTAEDAALAAQDAAEQTNELLQQFALESESSDDGGRSVPAPALGLVLVAIASLAVAAGRRR